LEFQRDTVDAVAQVGRWRPVIKHVPKMAAATAADNFVTDHAVAAIGCCLDRAGQRIVEARPAGSALEFHFLDEPRLIAGNAAERPGTLLIQQCATSGHLCCLLAHDRVLLRGQYLAPFRFGVCDRILSGHDRAPRVRYLIAKGLTGEPTAPVIGMAGAT